MAESYALAVAFRGEKGAIIFGKVLRPNETFNSLYYRVQVSAEGTCKILLKTKVVVFFPVEESVCFNHPFHPSIEDGLRGVADELLTLREKEEKGKKRHAFRMRVLTR